MGRRLVFVLVQGRDFAERSRHEGDGARALLDLGWIGRLDVLDDARHRIHLLRDHADHEMGDCRALLR
jgi:hypothetical protein